MRHALNRKLVRMQSMHRARIMRISMFHGQREFMYYASEYDRRRDAKKPER